MKSIMKSSHLFFTYTVAFIPKIILYALFSGTIPSAGNHKTVRNYECLQAKQLGAEPNQGISQFMCILNRS